MPSPFATLTTYFNAEWRVNGLWNALLSHHYPPMFGTTGFVSCPEAFAGVADTQGFQADLAIRQMTLDAGTGTWKMSLPWVVFEGKGGTVSTTWDAIRDQLHAWCDKGDGGSKFNLWAIAARGSMVTFYYYHGDHSVMQAVAWQNGLVPDKEQHLDLTKITTGLPSRIFSRMLRLIHDYRGWRGWKQWRWVHKYGIENVADNLGALAYDGKSL